jgi:hypothetical protein
MNTLLNQQLVRRIRAEYVEMPGMKLTIGQVQRLCGIEQPLCKAALESLIQARFLCIKSDGSYVRLEEGRSMAPRAAKAELKPARLRLISPRAS